MKALKVAFTLHDLWLQFSLQCNEAKSIASFIEVVHYIYMLFRYMSILTVTVAIFFSLLLPSSILPYM